MNDKKFKVFFKAWDKKTKKWLGDFRIHPHGVILSVIGSKDGRWQYSTDANPDAELVYNIGCVDKDGQDIFTGHILLAEDNRLSVVEYDAPHFILRHKPENGSDFIAVKNKFKIIGNIYENPELIKGL